MLDNNFYTKGYLLVKKYYIIGVVVVISVLIFYFLFQSSAIAKKRVKNTKYRQYQRKDNNVKIEKILSQIRRDFKAIYICEHCGNKEKSDGYDDKFFHENVIPKMKCKNCGEKAGADYRPLATKYPENLLL